VVLVDPPRDKTQYADHDQVDNYPDPWILGRFRLCVIADFGLEGDLWGFNGHGVGSRRFL
jgi:hypothetical protein